MSVDRVKEPTVVTKDSIMMDIHAYSVTKMLVLLGALSLSPLVFAEVAKPGTPLIELLEEVPEKVVEAPDSSLSQGVAATQVDTALPMGPEFLRPTSSTLSGSDSQSNVGRPVYLQSIQGMDSGVQITRVTPDESFGSHSYSRRQAWNANETRMDISRKILDTTNNYNVLFTHSMSSERVWSSTNPDLIYGLATNPKRNNFAVYNIATQKRTILRTFSVYEKCTIGEYEGNISNDDRYVLLTCEDSSGTTDLVSYDIETDTVLGKIQAAADLNWASFSQSGNYVIVENNAPGQNIKQELVRYDKYLQNKLVLTNQPAHGDLGYDENGDDVHVMISWDTISYIRIRDGKRVDLSITNRAGDGHVSCRAVRRPGWCYFSTKNENQRIGAVKISEQNSVVELWGYSKSSYSQYSNQPQVSVSPSGEKMIFSSDWWGNLNRNTPHTGGGGSPSEYVLELTK